MHKAISIMYSRALSGPPTSRLLWFPVGRSMEPRCSEAHQHPYMPAAERRTVALCGSQNPALTSRAVQLACQLRPVWVESEDLGIFEMSHCQLATQLLSLPPGSLGAPSSRPRPAQSECEQGSAVAAASFRSPFPRPRFLLASV